MEFFTFLSAGFWLNLFWFLLAFFFSVFLPGLLITQKTKIFKEQSLVLVFSPILGICLFAFQGYLLGYLNLRWATYLYLLFFAYWLILKYKFWLQLLKESLQLKKIKLIFKNNKLPIFILLVGVISQVFPVFYSGWLNQNGLTFYFLNAFDGVFHLSSIESIKTSFPPIQPGAWSLPISNYHYWSDLTMAEFARIWHLPVISLYFHFFPPLISLLIGLLVYKIPIIWTGKKKAGIFALIFYYFAGDFSYIFSLIINRSWGEAVDVFDNGIIQFINTPQAFAKLIFFGSVLLFDNWIKEKKLLMGVVLAILISSLFGFKIYFGIFALLGLGLVLLCHLVQQIVKAIKNKESAKTFLTQNKKTFLLGFCALIFSLIVFLPTNKEAGGLFWAPLTWPKLFIAGHKLNWNEWWLRMQVYEAAKNIKALFVYNSMLLALFLVSVFNFRLFGFLAFFGLPKKSRWELLLFLFFPTIICGFVGINFLQVAGGHNVFNFFVVCLASLNLLLPVVIIKVLKKPVFIFVFIFLFVLSLPRTFLIGKSFIINYLRQTDNQTISMGEIEALNFLKNQPGNDLLLQSQRNYLNFETPYTYFLSKKFSYLSGTRILYSHNQPIEDREIMAKYIFTATDSAEVADILKKEDIKYIYFKNHPAYESPVFLSSTISAARDYFQTAFKNQEVEILIVK